MVGDPIGSVGALCRLLGIPPSAEVLASMARWLARHEPAVRREEPGIEWFWLDRNPVSDRVHRISAFPTGPAQA